MHHHGGHHGGYPDWIGGYLPLDYTDRTNYAPQYELETVQIPTWAIVSGLGLLAIIALRK